MSRYTHHLQQCMILDAMFNQGQGVGHDGDLKRGAQDVKVFRQVVGCQLFSFRSSRQGVLLAR